MEGFHLVAESEIPVMNYMTMKRYRMCLGVLNFTKKYSRVALEECCSRALELNKVTYTFIKTTIADVAEDIGSAGFNIQHLFFYSASAPLMLQPILALIAGSNDEPRLLVL